MCVIHEIHQIHSDDERGERALEAFYLASISIGGQTQMEYFKIMKTEKGGGGSHPSAVSTRCHTRNLSKSKPPLEHSARPMAKPAGAGGGAISAWVPAYTSRIPDTWV